MAATKPVPRQLIYSFQTDAVKKLLSGEASSRLSGKIASKLDRAISDNEKNPLFREIKVGVSSPVQAGRWWTLWPLENHLRIKGTVGEDCKRVAIFINDRLVKLVNTVPKHNDSMSRRLFRFNMRADILARLPRGAFVGVGSEAGYLRHRSGRLTYKDPRLEGDGKLFELLADGYFLTKKGRVLQRLDQNESWKIAALGAYSEFRGYFESTFGYKPFIICGTLLGYHRESDFIAHDDDMDVAYFSKYSRPEDIRTELRDIVSRMLLDGYDIKLARKSGFFKPAVNGILFDVFPMWSDSGSLWMMNTTRQRAGPERILPLRTASFRGVDVYIPNDTPRYIESEYGPGWNIPDPGYRAVAEPGTPDYLSGSCLTTEEIKAIYREIESTAAEQPSVGKLSIAELDIEALL
jgi:hypothetical protein